MEKNREALETLLKPFQYKRDYLMKAGYEDIKQNIIDAVLEYIKELKIELESASKEGKKLDFKDDLELLKKLKKNYQAALGKIRSNIFTAISSIEEYKDTKKGGKKTKKRKKNKQGSTCCSVRCK